MSRQMSKYINTLGTRILRDTNIEQEKSKTYDIWVKLEESPLTQDL